MATMRRFLRVLLSCCVYWVVVCGQISKPIASDDAINIEDSKFLQRKPELDYQQRTREEDEEIISSTKHCFFDLHMRWMSQVSSSVYSSPVIVDLFSDNRKEILVPSHVHYFEALESEDGAQAVGWPVYHKSHLHGSPFMHDIDRDGILDIGIATYNGEITFYKDTGEKMMHSMSIPPLRVKRDWYVGLNPDPVDHSHMDVGKEMDAEEIQDTKEDEVLITRRRLLQEATVEGNGQVLTDAAGDSFKVFETTGDDDDGEYYLRTRGRMESDSRGRRNGIYDEEDAEEEVYRDLDQHKDYEHYHYWDDEDWDQAYSDHHESEFVYLDGHVLSTPVVADIDGDGLEELVVAVSYFFDEDFYSRSELNLLPKDIDRNKYLAGGIVVFDLSRRYVKWSTHLDMTTQNVKYPAYMTSAPSVMDIDGDGRMEIVVGNQAGFLYVLDRYGDPREGWPKQMGSITTQTLVDDLNGDGKMEIMAVDVLGNVAMFDIDGKEIWERHFMSSILGAPTAGDVTGNGELDIVFGTTSGHVYVLDAKNGQDRSPFPFRVHGSIRAPITITRLKEGPGQQLIFMAFDGYLYVMDGETACVDARDIGEDSYSMVLVDDLSNDGKLDLVVTTMNGNVYLFETGGAYHPMRTWTSEVRAGSACVSRDGHVGIFASKESRARRDIRGERFIVRFSIVDKRPRQLENTLGPYNVTVILKNVGVNQMNTGPSPVIGVMEIYGHPGTYELIMPCPRTRTTALVQLIMIDSHRREYRDEFALSFHMHWYKFIKWLVVGPFTLMAMAAVLIKPNLMTQSLPA